jgi:putative ABC transport system ATP-binding protein
MALLQDLNSKGKTIVFVTHEADIAKFMTRQVVFRDGHIIREEMVTDRNNAVELLKALPIEELV